MTKLGNKPFCYWVSQIPNGSAVGKPGHFFPAIVVPNEAGYYMTDWDWGTDRETAEQCCAEMNTKLGLNEEQVMNMVRSSMAAGKIGDA